MSELDEKYFDYESGGCYCSTTNNPPCSYCEGHSDCEACGRHFKCDELNEMKDGRHICAECYEEERDAEG